jgi:hypothetical protein
MSAHLHVRSMQLYWRQQDVPSLRELSDANRKAVVAQAIPQIAKRWQVWLPVAAYVLLWAVEFRYGGRSLPLLVLTLVVAIPIILVKRLVVNHYLDQYLRKTSGKTPMPNSSDAIASWLSGESVPGTRFRLNDSIRICGGRNRIGEYGSVVSLLTVYPLPRYRVVTRTLGFEVDVFEGDLEPHVT